MSVGWEPPGAVRTLEPFRSDSLQLADHVLDGCRLGVACEDEEVRQRRRECVGR